MGGGVDQTWPHKPNKNLKFYYKHDIKSLENFEQENNVLQFTVSSTVRYKFSPHFSSSRIRICFTINGICISGRVSSFLIEHILCGI